MGTLFPEVGEDVHVQEGTLEKRSERLGSWNVRQVRLEVPVAIRDSLVSSANVPFYFSPTQCSPSLTCVFSQLSQSRVSWHARVFKG